jgi:putative ABC transport system permease protein
MTSTTVARVRRSLGPWRVAARLARRSLAHAPGWAALVALLVAVPVAALVVLDALYRTTTDRTDRGRLGHAELRLDLPVVDAPQYRAGAGAYWLEAFLPLRGAGEPASAAVDTEVRTVDLAAPLTRGIERIAAGRRPAAPDEAAVSLALADRARLGVGDTWSLEAPAQTFRIVGLLADRPGRPEPVLVAPGFDPAALDDVNTGAVLLFDRADTRLVRGPLGGDLGPWKKIVSTRSEITGTRSWELLAAGLAATFALAVVGVVIAAAFAISARRQLVAIGQLAAAGADAVAVRRVLALQGTGIGVAGAATGVLVGRLALAALERPAFGGWVALAVLDWMVIAVAAVVVSTLAAIAPARSLVRSPVLAALQGRRPVTPVRAGPPVVAGVVTVVGLVVLFAAGRLPTRGVAMVAVLVLVLALAGSGALLAGVVSLCPYLVAAAAMLGRSRRGALRLALRELDRHRRASGATVAAIAVVGAGGLVVGSVVESGSGDATAWPRTVVIGVVAASIALVVALALALGAAEQRDERAMLAVLGASRRTMAAVPGWKAWVLATTGGIVGVGLGVAAPSITGVVAHPIPWAVVVAVVAGIPLGVAGVGAVAGAWSFGAARRRPSVPFD